MTGALCETCQDLRVVLRIRGGVRFEEPCPDCGEAEMVDPDWNVYTELADDSRAGR